MYLLKWRECLISVNFALKTRDLFFYYFWTIGIEVPIWMIMTFALLSLLPQSMWILNIDTKFISNTCWWIIKFRSLHIRTPGPMKAQTVRSVFFIYSNSRVAAGTWKVMWRQKIRVVVSGKKLCVNLHYRCRKSPNRGRESQHIELTRSTSWT